MPGIVEIEKPVYYIPENVGVLEIGVIRLDGTDGEIMVRYATKNQTARSGKDFEPVQGELIFGEGEKRKTILVPIVDDDQREPMEQFEVHLLDPTPGPGVINFKGLGSTQKTVVIIRDDDIAGINSGKCPEVNLNGDGLMLGLPDVTENSSR
ncbi:g-protein coupled receptor 98 [Trichonephila clavipes]|nr:g-protein coupled receptor 98 [Trichonephila clavipes]